MSVPPSDVGMPSFANATGALVRLNSHILTDQVRNREESWLDANRRGAVNELTACLRGSRKKGRAWSRSTRQKRLSRSGYKKSSAARCCVSSAKPDGGRSAG